ncbi:MAG: methyltransferase domain-containing protein [Tabrizicola sp.]|uniref:methyltransferase domain-containing protein n=1 Tax=Tabrizicola sp. TaxID=2005166 RepID=UPI002736E358|nr:methyltransferase domain-containing protein [Tabrizicola sp.]MDP3262847.1 methyltransferase domain-containing protein [Tabrizicola sp.]MDP3649044.1 methyltransferase domain-containing protein [Paracoccaceae bacterium]MDZ4068765.1 methyltransferase domain-containing protein [Tabrizicola sp.]
MADRGGDVTEDAPGHYTAELIDVCEAIWGEGFLSPGGTAEVGRIVGSEDIRGAAVLEIGSGAGGTAMALIEGQGAGYVTGIDVEDGVLTHARQRIEARGLTDRIGLVKVVPGPLPFPPDTFDVVFSKEAILHIADKQALMAEVFRVLRPGGRFLASDWLLGSRPPSAAMEAYIAAEGLDFEMATADDYRAAMEAAGFDHVVTRSRTEWYRREARDELARLKGPLGRKAEDRVGKQFVDRNIAIWERMIPVLDAGEHCPTHLSAVKP